MTPKMAIKITRENFPFEGYMDRKILTYLNLSKIILRYLKPGNRILDFGSGPCDKTAILKLLGFDCSAYDDLQDPWHNIENNKEKIISFTRNIGINFQLASNNHLPFEKDSFDMVMMNDVLEHIHDSPCNILNALIELIKPNGYLFVTVPNAVSLEKRVYVLQGGRSNYPRFETYFWCPGPWRGHIREYTRNDLKKLCIFLNLKLVKLHGFHNELGKYPKFARPFYQGITSIFDGWRDAWYLVAQKSNWKPCRHLSLDEYQKIVVRY